MKVEVNGKIYCVETLIADNERLRKDVIASAEYHRLVLDKIRAEIEQLQYGDYGGCVSTFQLDVLQIIDKYKAESEVQE